MDLGSRISAWLRVKGMTQMALAAAIGVSRAAVSNWCTGVNTPSHAHLQAVVAALGVTLPEFYGAIPAVAEESKAKPAA